MSKQIEDFESNCFTCSIPEQNKLNELMIAPKISTYSWEKLGCDLFYILF